MSSIDRFLGELADAGGTSDRNETLSWPPMIKHLSATSIGMFRRCPQQFKYRYILGEKERPGESIVIGSAFHGGLEHNYRQKVDSHVDIATSEVVEYLQDAVVPAVLEENGGADEIAWDSQNADKGVQVMRLDSERMLVRYHEQVVPRIQPISIEEKHTIEDSSLPVPLIGYIDVRSGYELELDNTSMWVADRILDTKTGKQAVSKLKPSWQLQATLYGAMTGLPVEYNAISRAAMPKIVTALESPDMVYTPNDVKTANVIKAAASTANMIAWCWTHLGPDETWPTWGRFADWSMSFLPCTNCGWRKVCPAMAGEDV